MEVILSKTKLNSQINKKKIKLMRNPKKKIIKIIYQKTMNLQLLIFITH